MFSIIFLCVIFEVRFCDPVIYSATYPAHYDLAALSRETPPSKNVARRKPFRSISFPPYPPWHGSSPALFVYGGAQRGSSLATGIFTGESRRNPLGGSHLSKLQYINGLDNHDHAVLDSFAESKESTFRKPPWPESSQRNPPFSIRDGSPRATPDHEHLLPF